MALWHELGAGSEFSGGGETAHCGFEGIAGKASQNRHDYPSMRVVEDRCSETKGVENAAVNLM